MHVSHSIEHSHTSCNRTSRRIDVKGYVAASRRMLLGMRCGDVPASRNVGHT